jgi:hypothetical protein
MASMAVNVFPVPVGRTTTPRPPAFHQASTASVWWGNGVRVELSFQFAAL